MGITGDSPNNPPKESVSPAFLPIAGITRTAVVFEFTIPIAASSAIIPEIMSADVVINGLNPQEILRYFEPDDNSKIIAAEVIGLPDGSIGEKLYQAKIYLSTGEVLAWTVVIIFLSVCFEQLVGLLLRLLQRRLIA